jgi:glycosyltransferase involved in cell wall biosynthesis
MKKSPFTIFVPEIETFGGAERAVIALSHWMHDHALPHRFLLYYDAIDLSKYASHPIERVILEPARNPVSKIAALRRWTKALPPNTHPPLMSGIQAATHATLAGLRGFHTMMHDTPSLLNNESPSIERRLRRIASNRVLTLGLNSGGTMIVNSEYLKAESERLWRHPPVIVARMGGVAGKTFRARTVERRLRMLSLCRVEENKRIDWILRSLANLEDRAPKLSARIDWHLDVAGDGSLIGPLSELTQQLGLTSRVTFHGFVPDDRLEDYYDRADLFLMPARQGYGLPAAEALYRGIPVLLHVESGISELLADTPWATMMDGGEINMPGALDQAVTALVEGRHLSILPPDLPTADGWAEQVCRISGWYH